MGGVEGGESVQGDVEGGYVGGVGCGGGEGE